MHSPSRSSAVRLVIGLLCATLAARAGYNATLALAHIGIPSEWWRQAFVAAGVIIVAGKAIQPTSLRD